MSMPDLLKHFVRVDGWVTLARRFSRRPLSSYFTFCSQDAIDVFTLAAAGALDIESDGSNLGLCESDENIIPDVQTLFPQALLLTDDFYSVLSAEERLARAQKGESSGEPSEEQRRRIKRAEMKQQLVANDPFQFVNLDVFDRMLPNNGTVGSTFMTATKTMLDIQSRAGANKLALSITCSIGADVDPGVLEELRSAVPAPALPSGDLIWDQALMLPFWYAHEIGIKGYSLRDPRSYFYMRSKGYGIFTWMAILRKHDGSGLPNDVARLVADNQTRALDRRITLVEKKIEEEPIARMLAENWDEVQAYAARWKTERFLREI